MDIDPQNLLVPFDDHFSVGDSETQAPENVPSKKALEKELASIVAQISDLQRKLYACNRHAVLLIFQAMDAAGKDGTIRAVMSGVNPAGCNVSSFKSPSNEELEHDWLWRTTSRLPERGRIAVFNRSYYEEVLAVRVHPEYLAKQRLPETNLKTLWQERFDSIREHEKHLSRNGTVVLKFWLNVSKEEQKKRFLKRLTTPEKHWKFSRSDLSTRSRWDDYMEAYESLLNETSTENAPWYAVPADNKRYMRLCVARIVLKKMQALPLRYPEKSAEEIALFEEHIRRLNSETD
ncbi:MAG: PPK2 family polyphosphate:nucleotide phosphotransferase [Granulosicoccus sp.]|jgi:PPK2 family polyphosphate:nucleotide phosphotransferase